MIAERLTFEGNFCDIAKCRKQRWGKYCPDGACSQRKVWERLKEYEDAADVATVRHGRCPVCSGQEVLAQDCDNGYSVEIDAESQEMTLWNGDTCLAAISVDYCPVCGAKMDGAE